MLNIWVTYAVA